MTPDPSLVVEHLKYRYERWLGFDGNDLLGTWQVTLPSQEGQVAL